MDITLKGRICRDPDAKYTYTGKLVCSCLLYVGDTSIEAKRENFLNLVRWEDNLFATTLKKGDDIEVTGYYKTEKWYDKLKDEEKSKETFVVKDWKPIVKSVVRLINNNKYCEKVQKGLNEYLKNFGYTDTIEDLLKNTDAVVYGGATRDIIAEQKINDLDICCLSKSFDNIYEKLVNQGFDALENKNKYLGELYIREKILFNPMSFENNNHKIQLIRPIIDIDSNMYQEMLNFIKGVDIRACSIIFTSSNKLIELVSGAINDCENKYIKVQDSGKWYHKDRIQGRINKFIKRGWSLI